MLWGEKEAFQAFQAAEENKGYLTNLSLWKSYGSHKQIHPNNIHSQVSKNLLHSVILYLPWKIFEKKWKSFIFQKQGKITMNLTVP